MKDYINDIMDDEVDVLIDKLLTDMSDNDFHLLLDKVYDAIDKEKSLAIN